MGHKQIEKKCGACQAVKPVDEFYSAKGTKRGRDGYCKACRRARDRIRLSASQERHAALKAMDPHYFRRRKLVKMYNLTQETYEEMFKAQGGVCAICTKPEVRVLYGAVSALVIDHNHDTGKVRALLCSGCNTRLGSVEDATFRAKALAYLAVHAVGLEIALPPMTMMKFPGSE